MSKLGISLVVLGLMFIAVLCATEPAEAHHNGGILPYVPNTPAIRYITQTQEVTWCTDTRANAYPDFVNQIKQVNASYAEEIGVSWRYVGIYDSEPAAYAAGCLVWHTMPDNHPCSGCAADVFYASRVAQIRYKWQLNFSSWLSTIGHEIGHIFGMHEAYDDSRFISHINTYGYWASPWNAPTVMDVGSHIPYPPRGIWGPTAADVNLICTRAVVTSWCGQQPEPEPTYYEAPDGWRFYFDSQNWHDSRDVPRFGPCNSDRLRLDLLDAHWWRPGGFYMGFDYDYGRHVTVPGC